MLDSEDQNLSIVDSADSQPTPPRRRRAASRPAGPPQAAAVVEPVAAEATPADEAPAAPEAKPKRTRRAKVAVEPVVDKVADAAVSEPALEVASEPVAPRTSRRRRAAAPADEAPAATDEVAASLDTLASTRTRSRKRTPAVAETFGLGEEVSADDVLDSLAAAISGQPLEREESEEELTDELVEGEDAEDSDAPRRRRRRRGGRRRRRGSGDAEVETDAEASEESDTDDTETETDGEAEGDAEAGTGTASSRRRRRRRRRGEDTGEADDDTVDVVVRVREPRRRASLSDEVTGIEGSTRMEAKKQRRREGRAAGRRRTPILSESEFLARRESVDRKMLIRQADGYSQIAVLEDNILVEHYVDRASATSMIGNIYLGRVQNVLPSMEAAFVDIGRGRNAVLYAGEVDWDSFGVSAADKKVEKVFKSGQQVLVQVSKDPVGAKGARLTSHLSIPGRYIVYSPGGHLSGISRKLPENERRRLKAILDELIDPQASVIVRTAAEGASEEELVRDVNRLKAQWEVLEKKSTNTTAPQLLYAEPDLTVRIVRDLFTEDFGGLVIDGNGQGDDAYDNLDAYVQHVAPHLAERLQRWDRTEKGDIFSAFRVHEQVSKALERKVFLPSGGSLIIDRTEAMTVIDVNTGRFTGTTGNLEATVTSNNLEAAEEIVRQLRLRDIGGIIVIDFIDMVLPANRELLLRRLVECLGRDRTRHQVAEVTSLGLVQMTRKKIGTGLAEAFTVACETCKGRGYHVHDAPVATQAPADGGEREGRRRAPAVKPTAGKPTATPAKRASRSRKAVVADDSTPALIEASEQAEATPAEPGVEAVIETAAVKVAALGEPVAEMPMAETPIDAALVVEAGEAVPEASEPPVQE